eukprot:gene9080-10352_t
MMKKNKNKKKKNKNKNEQEQDDDEEEEQEQEGEQEQEQDDDEEEEQEQEQEEEETKTIKYKIHSFRALHDTMMSCNRLYVQLCDYQSPAVAKDHFLCKKAGEKMEKIVLVRVDLSSPLMHANLYGLLETGPFHLNWSTNIIQLLPFQRSKDSQLTVGDSLTVSAPKYKELIQQL